MRPISADDRAFSTALGLSHSQTGWVVYPLDVISKRMKDGSAADLVSIVDVFAQGGPKTPQNQMGTVR
jgi:hypothetical protein